MAKTVNHYVYHEPDAAGHDRVYVRRHGRRIRIKEPPGTPAFLRAVARALESLERPGYSFKGPAKNTLGFLVDRYFASPEFLALNPVSQRTKRAILARCLAVPFEKLGMPMAHCPLEALTPGKIRMIRDAAADKRGAANKRLQHLSACFSWAVEHGRMTFNPCRDVKKFRYKSDGFHTWTSAEVVKFEKHYPVGTKQRLALALLFYLGVRRSDVVRLRPDMVRNDVLFLTPAKTLHLRSDESAKPILPELAAIIAASPTGREFFLETSRGKPFTAAGFTEWFRDQCDAAGLPECSAHGLRKAGATLAAERGATASQLMALYDWRTLAVAEKYIKTADRKRLAADAASLLVNR